MKIVLLCGGIGKRMFPLMEDKFLLKFLGKTLLEHHLGMARDSGFSKFVVIGNPDNIERIKALLADKGYDADYSIQQKPDGMANALLSAKDILHDDEIIIVNPNDIFDKSAYDVLLREAKNSDADSFILGQEVSAYFPGGYLVIDENNHMEGISEKPGEGNEPSNLVNIVVHYHRKPEKLLEYIENTKSTKDDVYESSIDRMIRDGFKFKAVKYNGVWKAIKYPWHIFGATKYFMDRMLPKASKNAKMAPSAVVEGNVIIEDGARIMENAVVKGPCFIGRNAVIGNNCLVREYSQIGDNSVVGFSTEVKNSYIGDNCWFHTSYVGDSVIADNCSLAAGTITTNVRLDGKDIKVDIFGKGEISSGLDHLGVIMGENCKTGSNATIMPGVRIGPNSAVGPGVVLRDDLEPNKMIFTGQEHIVKDNNIALDTIKKEELMKKLRKLDGK